MVLYNQGKGNNPETITKGLKGEFMNNDKNFSYVFKVKNADGTTDTYNETNIIKGYRQSWFKTPKAAQKKLQSIINFEKTHLNREIIEACCFTRSGKTF